MLYLGHKDEEFIIRAVDDKFEIEMRDKTKQIPTEEELEVAMKAADFLNSRNRLMSEINMLASSEINKKYPIHKQMNISNLSGYTQADKDGMLAFILSIRNHNNTLEEQINKAANKEELDKIVWNFS